MLHEPGLVSGARMQIFDSDHCLPYDQKRKCEAAGAVLLRILTLIDQRSRGYFVIRFGLM
jgi:hypothetical protein